MSAPVNLPRLFRCEDHQLPYRFLDEAFELWETGHEVAAGCLARSALELNLWRLCTEAGVVLLPDVRVGFYAYGMELLAVGVLDAKVYRRLEKLYAKGSRAVHGNRVQIGTIQNQLRRTKRFLETGRLEGGAA